jgi:hypothetical protein
MPGGMVTGHNADVRHEGDVYHVQTEDKGRGNPVIETLIYVGGQIIHHERSRYDDIAGDGYTEQAVTDRLDAQHRRMVAAVKAGQFAGETHREPFGEQYVSARSLDEVVAAFVEGLEGRQTVSLELIEHTPFQPGASARVHVRARNRGTGDPMAGVRLAVRVIAAGAEAGRCAEARTDDQGEARLEFPVPAAAERAVAMVETSSELGCDELKLLLSSTS